MLQQAGQAVRLCALIPKSQLCAPMAQEMALVARLQSTQAAPAQTAAAIERQKKKEKQMAKKAVHSKSFAQNLFRGMIEPEQAFPYPQVLNDDQFETLQMLVPIAERVMGEQNDPLKNDELETVPEDTVQSLRELGAFGLQVPEELGGVGLTNT